MSEVPLYTRISPRYQTTMLVGVEGEPALREHRGNVSVGGFYFEAERPYEPGTLLELLVRLPGAAFWLKGRGRVLSCEPQGSGVGVRGNFVDLDLGNTTSLREWLESIDQAYPEKDPAAGPRQVVEDPREETVLCVTTDPPPDHGCDE
ncbi:MAG TPA: PilZ domain-containing protein [Myxococcota bacterium]|nr:PilZ domain-containing protein [Myxococcota bacterium]HRY93813.1 PilZ domain-containing protein [Myxococcota bacterium]HSA21614.1 PilZ domain-containing protein [Myxococcota bacterium]